jgi:thiosulfate dehydrogenase (quinone) large subunit
VSPVSPGHSDPIVPARALVPLRLFLGGTFLYAGFDKLLDQRFFDPTSPASIQAQMLAFARVSPIAPLVRLAQPIAPQIGLLIAVAEIAIGLGALTGLAFRLAAWGGAGLSLLFFLTASWSTRPFYVGPDLPFAAGWITLALAGHGAVLVNRRLLDWAAGSGAGSGATGRRRRPNGASALRRGTSPMTSGEAPPVRDRRTVLQAGVLSLLALMAASLAAPFRLAGAERTSDPGEASETAGPGSSQVGSSSPGNSGATEGSAAPSAAPASPASNLVVGSVAAVGRTGASSFTVPFTAAAPLPAGDPGVIVKLGDGSFVAFDAVCTHAGCTVEWDRQDRLLVCPCHGAAFDPANRGAVLGGPTSEPLATIPIAIDPSTGVISLALT